MLQLEVPQNLEIDKCEIHPQAQVRFSYEKDLDGLVESIKRHGQLEPGRAVTKPDGSGFLVYIGGRRLAACKRLFSEKGRPNTYNAFVDEGLKDKDIVPRVIAEKATDKEQWTRIRPLEELHYLSSLPYPMDQIKEMALAGGMGKESLSKKIDLFRDLGKEDFERLHEIEEKTGFQFELLHLIGIWQYSYREKGTFFASCACAAQDHWSVEGLNEDLVQGAAPTALNIQWFSEIFPDLVNGKINDSSEGDKEEIESKEDESSHRKSTRGTSKKRKRGRGSARQSEDDDADDSPLDRLLKNAIKTSRLYYYVPCRKCGAEIPFDYNLPSTSDPAVTTYVLKEDGKLDGLRIELDSRFEGTIGCSVCETKWKLVLAPEGRKVRALLEPSSDEQVAPVGNVVEGEVTTYSREFNKFVIINKGSWFFFDSQIGRRVQMKADEIEKYKSFSGTGRLK